MKLVETDTTGPGEGPGEDLLAEAVTPPRPEHRQAMTSMVLTLAVLASTVTAVYLRFPARHNEILTIALGQHRVSAHEWDLPGPSAEKLDGWAVGLLEDKPPLPMPGGSIAVVGARRIEILDRKAALVRYRIGSDLISMIVQKARDIPARNYEQQEGEELAIGWREGPWTCIVVGPAATAPSWSKALGVP